MAEEELPGKVCLEHWLVWVSSWLLYDWHGLEAKKLAAMAIKKCQFGIIVSLDIQNAHNSMSCKGAGILPQHHPELLPRLSNACANSIGHDKKRDDMTVREGLVLGPLLWNIGGGCPTRSKYHLLHCWHPKSQQTTMPQCKTKKNCIPEDV